MRRTSRRVGVAALLALGLSITACGDDGRQRATPPDRGGGAGLAGPGTPIAGGFVVAEGTHLVGRAIPDLQRSAWGEPLGERWLALLAVDEDPAEAFDAYVAQAGALGVPLAASTGDAPCASAWGGTPITGAADLAAIDPRGVDLPIGCLAYSPTGSGSVEIEMSTTGPGDDARWAGGIVLRIGVDRPGRPPTSNDDAAIGDVGEVLPAPGDPPDPPSEGEPLAPAPPPPDAEDLPAGTSVIGDLLVPEGAVVPAPAATGTYPGSWVAVLHSEREPEGLVDELLGDDHPDRQRPVAAEEVDGETAWSGSWDEAGGDKLYVVAIEDGEGGWWVLVDATTDW